MLEKQLAAEMTRSEEQGRAKEQYDFLMKLLEADAGELEQSGAHLASENGKLLAMLQQEKQARLQEEAKRKEAEEKVRSSATQARGRRPAHDGPLLISPWFCAPGAFG